MMETNRNRMNGKRTIDRKSCLLAKVAAMMFCLLMSASAMAQNRIDQLVENFSTLGSAKFTSVIDRDPKTRRVQKVVKVLEMRGTQAGKFREAFKEESHTGNYSEQQEGDKKTFVLLCENPKEHRIYMLRQEGRTVPHFAKITIIIKKK